jgi:hypothetical protein
MKMKKIKRLFLDPDVVDGKPVYDPNAEFCPNFEGSVFQPRGLVDPGPLDLQGLTLRQKLFVDAYVGPAAGQLPEAAFLAGYGPRDKKNTKKHGALGYQVLRIAMVQEAIARELAKKKLSEEWTKLTLFEIANSNINNFFDIDESGERLKLNFHKATALGAMRQLKDYEVRRDGSIKVSVHDAMPALSILAKFYAIYRDGAGVESKDLPLEEDSRSRTIEPPAGTVPSNGNGHGRL